MGMGVLDGLAVVGAPTDVLADVFEVVHDLPPPGPTRAHGIRPITVSRRRVLTQTPRSRAASVTSNSKGLGTASMVSTGPVVTVTSLSCGRGAVGVIRWRGGSRRSRCSPIHREGRR